MQNNLTFSDALIRVRQAQKTEWNKIRSENPNLSGMEMKAETHIYKKRPPGFSRVYHSILDNLLSRGHADKTQKEILDLVRPNFSHFNIPSNIWNKKLNKKQLDKMKWTLDHSSQSGTNIAGCRTLADIKKRIQAHAHSTNAHHTFKGVISIDAATVVVRKKPHLIESKGTGKYHYSAIRVTAGKKRIWLRVDALSALLEK